MEFKEEFQKHTANILQYKVHITNEETTKQSLIIPFIKMLGYDTSNPLEVCSEYSAGFNKDREKVDYAIFKNGKVIAFIEAKPINDVLKNHNPQLAKYFNSSPEAKFAILTNGIKYKFYTDLEITNIIDTSPFFELDFENLKDNDIETLQNFSKDLFDVASLVSSAWELAYSSKLKPEIITLLRNPSDDLIKLLIKNYISDERLTSNVIGRYRTVVKNAITDALLEMFRQGITNQLVSVTTPIDAIVPFKSKEEVFTTNNLPTMKALFDWGIIKTGGVVYLKNRPDEKAVVEDYKNVNYKGAILSFNQWGQQITGWKSICIYDHVIVEGQTETLSVLRRNKLTEIEKMK